MKRVLRPLPSLAFAASQRGEHLADERSALEFHQDRLFGGRGLRRPLIAVATKKDMGPARHALAQMVVAGTMVVHPPLKAGAGPPPPAEMGPRVLTFTPPPIAEPAAAPPPPPPRPSAPPPTPRPKATTAGPKAASRWQKVDGDTEVQEKPLPDGRVTRTERRTLFRFDGSGNTDE
jgi:hypothetical protein